MTKNEHIYAICCRPEVAGDDISRENVNTIGGYALFNVEVANSSSFRDIKNHLGTAEAAAADINDSINPKSIFISLKNCSLSFIVLPRFL